MAALGTLLAANMDLEAIMDMRKLPGDPIDAYVFDWDRFLAEGALDEDLLELNVQEAKAQHREPKTWRKVPHSSLWRFPPS